MSRTVCCIVLLVALSGCRQPPSDLVSTTGPPSPAATTPAVDPSLGGEVLKRGLPLGELEISRKGRSLVRLEVELAENPLVWSTGLMNVEDLPRRAGMAFLFPAITQTSFYMKNTLVPLDIAFWDEKMTIVDILRMMPCDKDPCQAYTPSNQYLGALEVNRGLFDSEGIRVGDRVTLRRR
jgi:uncharacterized protein